MLELQSKFRIIKICIKRVSKERLFLRMRFFNKLVITWVIRFLWLILWKAFWVNFQDTLYRFYSIWAPKDLSKNSNSKSYRIFRIRPMKSSFCSSRTTPLKLFTLRKRNRKWLWNWLDRNSNTKSIQSEETLGLKRWIWKNRFFIMEPNFLTNLIILMEQIYRVNERNIDKLKKEEWNLLIQRWFKKRRERNKWKNWDKFSSIGRIVRLKVNKSWLTRGRHLLI